MGQKQTAQSPRRPTHGDAGGFGHARRYGLAVALVATGILGLELSAGLGWALVVLGGCSPLSQPNALREVVRRGPTGPDSRFERAGGARRPNQRFDAWRP